MPNAIIIDRRQEWNLQDCTVQSQSAKQKEKSSRLTTSHLLPTFCTATICEDWRDPYIGR